MPGVRNRESESIQTEGKEMADAPAKNEADVWESAPDAPLIPYLTNEQRAALVNEKATIYITGMEYESQGRFGARFLATLIAPDGNGYHYGFTSAGGNGRAPSPRDLTNKWMRDQIRGHKADRIPAQLCKRGNSYYLDKPGAESDRDETVPEMATGGATEVPDEPPF